MYRFTDEYIDKIISQVSYYVERHPEFTEIFAFVPFPFIRRVLFGKERGKENPHWITIQIANGDDYHKKIVELYASESMSSSLTKCIETRLTELGKEKINDYIYKI